MSYYLTALKAEFIKKRKTGTYSIAIILGFLLPVIYLIVQLFSEGEDSVPGIPFNYYNQIISLFLDGFGYFFFPLLIIITAAKITHIDHKNRGWDLMETQPLSKFSIYFSKLTVLLIGNLIAIISFLMSSFLVGWILSHINKVDVSAQMNIPFGYMSQLGIRLFVAGLFLSGIMLLISIWFKNFIIPILIGFFAMIGSLILSSNFGKEKMWNPFTVLKQTTEYGEGSSLNHFFLYTEIISLIGFVAITIIGFIYYKNKTFKRTFYKPANLIAILIVAILGIGAIAWVNTPNTYQSYGKTVISGTIDSDQDFKEVWLIEKFLNDSLTSIPVKEGKFHKVLDLKLPLNDYYISLVGSRQINIPNIVLSSGDSLNLQIQYYNGKGKVKSLTGTRLAENRYQKQGTELGYVNYLAKSNHYLDNPEKVAKEIYKHWKNDFEKGIDYRTRDNYTPRKDFKKRAKKLATVNYLNLWHTYFDKSKVVNPELAKNIPEEILKIKNHIPTHDNSLINNEKYTNYVLYEITSKDTTNTDFFTKRLKALEQMKSGGFKDRLLYTTLKKVIDETSNPDDRKEIMNSYADKISNRSLREKTYAYYQTKNSLAQGSPAPGFLAENPEGRTFRLSDFRGKMVVIDVWATWCGPCLKQAPYFERVAIKNKDRKNIVFIALSTDSKSDKKKWYLQVKNKTRSVIQLYLPKKQADKFTSAYILNSIPRYIFIDKEGNLIDSKMIFPKNPKFEQAINKELENG